LSSIIRQRRRDLGRDAVRDVLERPAIREFGHYRVVRERAVTQGRAEELAVDGVAGPEPAHRFACCLYAAGAVHAQDERVHMFHLAPERAVGDPDVNRVGRRRRQLD
jgi:hypothetical protein